MVLKFLQETHESILGKIKTDLSFIDPSIDLDRIAGMSVRNVQTKLGTVRESITQMKTGVYGSWLRSEDFVRASLLQEALLTIIEQKRDIIRGERLIPGATYYTDVTRFGNILEGKRAIFMGAEFTGWVSLSEHTAIAKAKQVMRAGSETDFREIYVGLADGSVDALNGVCLEHLTKSSRHALGLIEAYCDSRWEGPWPWEIDAPEKLKLLIENREEKKMKRIIEMQKQFGRILREFDEGTMNQFEMVAATQEMMAKVDTIISDLGKLSSTGIEVMAQAKSIGDDQMVEPMQAALGEPLNNAVTALTDLKAALSTATSDMATGDSTGAPVGADMGSPADAMGGDPMGGDPMGGASIDIDAMADVDIGGDEEERPMKGI